MISLHGKSERYQIILKGSILVLLLLVFPGCVTVDTSSRGDGGVFVSKDNGVKWEQKSFVLIDKGRTYSIAGTNILDITFDSTQEDTFYVGTNAAGAYVTFNGGSKFDPLPGIGGQVRSIVVDGSNNKKIYLNLADKIVVSDDRGATWSLLYTMAPEVTIRTLVQHPRSSNVLFIGASNGQLLRSNNAGESWSLQHTFDSSIEKILVNERNTSILYTATARDGLYRSANSGSAWVELEFPDTYSKSKQYHDVIFDAAYADGLIYASAGGIVRSRNGGASWSEITLITPEGTPIYSVAQNPRSTKELYYGTATHVYKSNDNGVSWVPVPLPTSRVPNILIFDKSRDPMLYMGVFTPQRQSSLGSLFIPQ